MSNYMKSKVIKFNKGMKMKQIAIQRSTLRKLKYLLVFILEFPRFGKKRAFVKK